MTVQVSTAAPPAGPKLERPRRRMLPRMVWGLAILAAIALLPTDAWLLWRDAMPVPSRGEIEAMIGAQRFDEAERALREVLRRSPHDGEAMVQLSRVFGGTRRYVESASMLRRVPEWWPTKSGAAFWEASSWKLAHRMRDAEAAWRRSIRDDGFRAVPQSYMSAAVMELLELMAQEERWDDAHELIWYAYDHADPSDHSNILVMWIRTQMERLEPATTLPILKSYLEADPEDWQARLAIARDEQALGNAAEATAQINACLLERPDDPDAWRERLAILHAQADLEALLEAIKSLPPSTADDPEIWKYRGLAAERADDWPGAAEAYRRALELKPSEAEYHYKLAMAEERLGNREAALEHRLGNKALREARGRLPEAYQDFLDSEKHPKPGRPTRVEAIRRLGRLCEELGWSRTAEGWRSLAE